ncbi:MAG: ABC transporter substrate-binding protein [Spirochaetales bacterium]|nr:ABC transporter substrate-binding protein [Spirochaetales bacterium]
MNKPTFKIGHLRITDHLILGITKVKLAKGIETFEKCDIETIAMTGWNSIGESLVAGDIDIAFMLAPYAMELFHSGQKITLTQLSHKSGSIIVANKRANIESIEDFKGKTVLIPYHLSVHHMLFDKLLREKGLTTGMGNDVVFEVVAPSQIPQMMEWDEDDDIGGYIVAEPFGTQVISAGHGTEFMLSKDIWPKHPCCVVVVRDEIIEKYPEGIAELTQSLVNSGKLAEQKKEVAAKIGASFLKQEVSVMEKILNDPPDRLSTSELLPIKNDLETIQNYLTNEISAMSGKIDLDKFVDDRFAVQAGAK